MFCLFGRTGAKSFRLARCIGTIHFRRGISRLGCFPCSSVVWDRATACSSFLSTATQKRFIGSNHEQYMKIEFVLTMFWN